ncbi:hypothetical protein [Dulcicalothrix desertica]|nr:hypothetical protein [Dulcicalothrix desertica]TWH62820.1 hypothetical protein CAL7102_00350 [Dulcicalothrix desertica PCC 7102]
MIKTFYSAFLTVAIIIPTPVYTQVQQGYPAPSNVPGDFGDG